MSIKKTKIGIALMVGSSLLVCVGQLFWKLGANGSYWWILCGFALYGLGALLMLIAYRFGDLSVLQPILSLNYVISLFLSVYVLQEPLALQKILAVSIILAGVILIGSSAS